MPTSSPQSGPLRVGLLGGDLEAGRGPWALALGLGTVGCQQMRVDWNLPSSSRRPPSLTVTRLPCKVSFKTHLGEQMRRRQLSQATVQTPADSWGPGHVPLGLCKWWEALPPWGAPPLGTEGSEAAATLS